MPILQWMGIFTRLIIAGLLSYATNLPLAYALEQCDDSTCGNCPAGYIDHHANCTPDGGNTDYCDYCSCIPSYKPSSGLSIAAGTGQDIIAYCSCKRVDNNYGSNAIFVPLNTSTEWTAFFNNAQSSSGGNIQVGTGYCGY